MAAPWDYGSFQPPLTSAPALEGPFLSSILSAASEPGFFTSAFEPPIPTIQVSSTLTRASSTPLTSITSTPQLSELLPQESALSFAVSSSTFNTSTTSTTTEGNNSTLGSNYAPLSGFATSVSTSILTVSDLSTFGLPSTVSDLSTVSLPSTVTVSAAPSWARPPHPPSGKPGLQPSNPDEATTSTQGSTTTYVILGILLAFGIGGAFITTPSVVRQVKKCLTQREP
ncbi:hypothetical protein EDD37DRAFT_486730 [Exophiala viscosa]|uniref:uncharacterized protein n=1 Tax=Exophiala viscosa TaxID=2486360 RepID=UPI00218EE980|nr:hypothetical protein EDD37DRAFT_486730 [Exophiala viscosa]